jgi:hypothetical protein
MQESDKGTCDFFVQVEPGDKMAPIARLEGKCPDYYQVAWGKGHMALIADDQVLEIVQRKPVAHPALPFPPSALAFDDAKLVASGQSDAEGVERDGKVHWKVNGKSYEVATSPGAKGYALVGRWHLEGDAWKEDSIGGVPLDPALSDAPCTQLSGWPASRDRLDPDAAPTLASPDWVDAIPEDLDGGLTSIAAGSWRVDSTRTLAVHGKPGATDEPVSWEGPIALWIGGKWQAVPDSTGELSMTVAPDWLLVDRDGVARLVSRRDGKVAWTDDLDLVPFLWPADLPVPEERTPRPPKTGGDARGDRPPQTRHPTGHKPGGQHPGGGGKGGHGGQQRPGGGGGGGRGGQQRPPGGGH